MCLAVPGRIVAIAGEAHGLVQGRVAFGGVEREICLSLVPEATVGDHVLVHAGFAITRLDPDQAERALETIDAMLGKGS